MQHNQELIGFILPPFVDLINRNIPEDQTSKKFLVSVGVCLIVAVAIKWNSLTAGSVDEALGSFALIFTESQAVYKLYFKDSYLRSKLFGKEETVEEVVG